MKDLPIFKLVIDDNLDSNAEVDFVALVDRPAIEKNFIAFNKQDESNKQFFAIQNEEQKIITGALMLANTPIYRVDERGEYYVIFEADAVKQIVLKFFKRGYQKNVNLMHDGGMIVEGLTMFESWIKDSKRGVMAMNGFENVPDGSWFGSFKVENEDVWQLIKDGKVKGFSVEGIFKYIPQKLSEAEIKLNNIINILKQVNNE